MLISIYPGTRGEHREMLAEADIAASGPFDSPRTIGGRFVHLPGESEIREILPNEVLFEGEVYIFNSIGSDGTFELIKAVNL